MLDLVLNIKKRSLLAPFNQIAMIGKVIEAKDLLLEAVQNIIVWKKCSKCGLIILIHSLSMVSLGAYNIHQSVRIIRSIKLRITSLCDLFTKF